MTANITRDLSFAPSQPGFLPDIKCAARVFDNFAHGLDPQRPARNEVSVIASAIVTLGLVEAERPDVNFHFNFLCLRLIDINQLEDFWSSRFF